MFDNQKITIRCVVCLVMAVTLFACSHHGPAPVINLSEHSAEYDERAYSQDDRGEPEPFPEYHQVEVGDTLFSIAWRYGVDYRQLAKINDIDNDYRIYPGQKLRFALPQIPMKMESFNPEKLQLAVKQALGLPIQAEETQSSQDKAPLEVSNNSQQSTQKDTGKVISHKKTAKSSRQVVSRSVKGQSKAFKVSRWFWPVKGPVLNGFSRKLHGNKGVDISGKPGQPVRAAAPGRVVYRGNSLKGYGNLIIVKHNEDYLSAYAHNSKIHVKENEIVKAGQVIADIGNSGTDQTKLHFEIRYRGKPVDPIKYLPKL